MIITLASTSMLIWSSSITFAASVAALASVRAVYKMRERNSYNEKEGKIELEMMRKELETQIYQMTNRLTATQEKWQDVNHAVLSVARKLEEKATIAEPNAADASSDFLSLMGVEGANEIENDKVFVLMPMHRKFVPIYHEIEIACHRLGLQVSRGDNLYIEGDVFSYILEEIVKSKYVLAVLDGRNPNVFYELGIAHALGKTVLMIAKSPDLIPFDLRTKQVLVYSDISELADSVVLFMSRISIALNKS